MESQLEKLNQSRSQRNMSALRFHSGHIFYTKPQHLGQLLDCFDGWLHQKHLLTSEVTEQYQDLDELWDQHLSGFRSWT